MITAYKNRLDWFIWQLMSDLLLNMDYIVSVAEFEMLFRSIKSKKEEVIICLYFLFAFEMSEELEKCLRLIFCLL